MRIIQSRESIFRSTVRHKVMIQVTRPTDINVDNSSIDGNIREILTSLSNDVTKIEHRTQGILVTILAHLQVGLVLTVQDVGSLSPKLGEVNLILDEDSEGLCRGEDSLVVSKGEDFVLYRTPGVHHTGPGGQVTFSCHYTMGCNMMTF